MYVEFSSPSDHSLIFVILILLCAKEALQLSSLLTFLSLSSLLNNPQQSFAAQ